jgi:nanoRNase/pAp phosphatase (c-di-AMP/oligoRNAs hydrolase)
MLKGENKHFLKKVCFTYTNTNKIEGPFRATVPQLVAFVLHLSNIIQVVLSPFTGKTV